MIRAMTKIFKDVWRIYVEQAKTRKAVRLLIKQEWSLEFLILLLTKVSKLQKQNISLILENKLGQKIYISCESMQVQQAIKKDRELDIQTGNITLQSLLDAAEAAGVM